MKKYWIIWGLLLIGILRVPAQDIKKDSSSWSLARCLGYAVQNNLTVKKSVLSKNTAEANYTQSKVSRFPSLTGSGSQTITNGSSIDPITSDYVSQVVRSTSFDLNAQVTLYNGNSINNQIKQNKLLVEQNDLFVAEAKNSITLSIVEAYLQALYYKEGIQVASNTLTSSQKQLEQSKAKFDAGSIAAKALADVQSQYANNQYSLILAKNNFEMKVLAIKQLLELDQQQSFEIEIPKLPEDLHLNIPNKIDVYQQAIGIMPEVKAGQTQVEINNLSLSMAKAGYLPTLSAFGSLSTGYTNTQHNSFATQLNGNFNQRIGLSLSVPIFDRYVTKTKVVNARIEMEKSKLSLAATNKDLYQKIETAWQNAVASQGEMESLLAAKNAYQTAYDLAQQQYALGAISSTDLVVSQNNFTNAEQKYLQTKYTCILYHQLLQFYQGNPIKL